MTANEKKTLRVVGGFDPYQLPPPIGPVPSDTYRPLWSVMIPTFNCAKYLEKTLESVLCQDPGPENMEIVVVDDCSSKDNPQEVVLRKGKGRVGYSRNGKNEGAIRTFNNCLRLSCGKIIHILHGDDYVLPGFYEMIENALQAHPGAGMAINRSFIVNAEGETESLIEREAYGVGPHFQFPNHLYRNGFATPGLVFRRQAVEEVGGFREDLAHCADWEITARVYSKFGGLYCNEPKACYRFFEGNDTSRLAKTGANVRERICMLAVFDALGLQIDRDRFLKLAIEQAENAANFFSKNGEQAAGQANHQIACQIAKLLSPRGQFQRKINMLKRLIAPLVTRLV